MYSPGKREEAGRLVEAISIIQNMAEDGLDHNGSWELLELQKSFEKGASRVYWFNRKYERKKSQGWLSFFA